MTFPDERDRELEELLRSTLHGAADSVTPAGDGLSRIQQRVAARRSRRLWLRPLAALGAVALVGGAGTLAYALTRPPQHSVSVTTTNPKPTALPSSTVAPSPTPGGKHLAAAFPTGAFYPFASAAAESAWESSGGPAKDAWMLDPTSAARRFLADFVQQPSVTQVVGTQATGADATAVTLGRNLSDGSGQRVVPVTTVHLVRFGKAWLVTRAADPGGYLRITSPATGSTIASPVTVSGPSYGVDETVAVDVRSLAGRDSTGPTAHASFGNGSPPWTVTLAFDVPQDARGAVVAVSTSAADGGPARIVANGVTFATTTLVDYPRYFYGVKDGRVAKLAARNGAAISYITDPQPAAGASDPQVAGDRVYFLVGLGTCSNVVKSAPLSGGTATVLATPRSGYTVTSFAVSADGRSLALFESACAPGGTQPQGLLVSTVRGSATSHTIEFPSFPPMVVGDPSWEPDGQHVDAVLRTGNLAGVVRWNAFTAKGVSDSESVCGDLAGQGLPTAVQLDRTGAAWVAVQSGQAVSVLQCVGGSNHAVFSVTGTTAAQDIAVTGNGQAVLLTDDAGRLWRWSKGASGAAAITPKVPQPQVSW